MSRCEKSSESEATVFAGSLAIETDEDVQVISEGEARMDRINSLILNDLQSPLTAMTGLLDLVLREAVTLRPDQAALIQRAYSITQSLNRSSQRLFHLYGANHAGLSPNSRFMYGRELVNATIAELESQAKWRQVTIVAKVMDDLRLYVDPVLLKEVLHELLLNAINVSQAQGQVTLEAAVEEGESKILLSVRDQGSGIPAVELDELFKEKGAVTGKSSFGGRRKRGTSLGLPLSSRIVQAHGGTLEVESAVGVGSVFRIRLPNPRPRILVVDDQQMDIDYLAMILDSLNVEIIKARNGPLALVALGEGARDSTGGSGIDLVITDIAMPGMNGFELLEQIVQDPLTAAIPVVLLTGEASMAQRVKGFRMGAADFVMKPIHPPDFLLCIRRLMGCVPGF
ncbi:MAG: hybrid sensor histidine kinase/response regulator [Magnetococcus sp. DMHC-1]|nr:response regulator [Magnetococcales bacterium]